MRPNLFRLEEFDLILLLSDVLVVEDCVPNLLHKLESLGEVPFPIVAEPAVVVARGHATSDVRCERFCPTSAVPVGGLEFWVLSVKACSHESHQLLKFRLKIQLGDGARHVGI